MDRSGPGHVAVIGAGIIGVTAAHALLDEGWRVTLVDPGDPGGPQAASHGNGAFISPASIIPMAGPGLWRQVPGFLMDPLGPLTIRWRHLPALAPWLLRFLRAGATAERVEATAGVLAGLLRDAPALHLALAGSIGRADLIRRDGLLYAYPDRAAFARDAAAWTLRRAQGLGWREVEGEALRRLEPALGPSYGFAAVLEGGAHCADPGGYVAALAGAAEARGARHLRARALDVVLRDGRLRGLRTEGGDLPCDAAVVAAGIHSRPLARTLGDRVPLVSERGYHVELPGAEGGPSRPVLPSDGRLANTPLAHGLRASGQVELASTEAAPDWRRADILLERLRRTYPGLRFDPDRVVRWQGHRPSTPDGLPVIGPSRACRDVVHAFGHGHVGLAAAPRTASLVASLLSGRPACLPLEPFAAGRFL
jgi:D-amino-acid dehydrogenase